ncbi:MAG: hypothetical protein Q7T36_13180 [Fluviicoccus sp.]|uniref:hypothetical protein n=1 Tax=Fluviicoccus sp. TaxID=2003552 RepID=UPI002728CE98|nr:hypothetical protein [Fluviicoccus sp.]MDO8331411.1 hypothetical protein [Fluviicoccus sp.]
MNTDLLLRVLSLCVLLASAETLHGIFRAAVIVPRIGKKRALKISIVTGSLLAFAVCWFVVPGMGIRGTGPLLGLGVTIALFMASFDVMLGKLVLKRPWRKAFIDFDPRAGNYLLFGVLLLITFPWVVMALR